jgi:hypothetical protein
MGVGPPKDLFDGELWNVRAVANPKLAREEFGECVSAAQPSDAFTERLVYVAPDFPARLKDRATILVG